MWQCQRVRHANPTRMLHGDCRGEMKSTGPPGAWNIDRNDGCGLGTGAVGTQKMALGTQMSIIAVARLTAYTANRTMPTGTWSLSEGRAARDEPSSIPLCRGAAKRSWLLRRKEQRRKDRMGFFSDFQAAPTTRCIFRAAYPESKPKSGGPIPVVGVRVTGPLSQVARPCSAPSPQSLDTPEFILPDKLRQEPRLKEPRHS